MLISLSGQLLGPARQPGGRHFDRTADPFNLRRREPRNRGNRGTGYQGAELFDGHPDILAARRRPLGTSGAASLAAAYSGANFIFLDILDVNLAAPASPTPPLSLGEHLVPAAALNGRRRGERRLRASSRRPR
jgi:hypothetical protein